MSKSLMRGLVFSTALGAVACTEVHRDQVPGAYHGEFDGEHNVLMLKPDGVFVWSTKGGDRNVKTRTGTWIFTKLEGKAGIVLNELDAGRVVASEQHDIDAPFGRLQISVNSERGWSLRRQ